MNKILIAVTALAISGVAFATGGGPRSQPAVAGSGSFSGTLTGGYAIGGGEARGGGRNSGPAGSYQKSRSRAFNTTGAGASVNRFDGRSGVDVEADVNSRGRTFSSSSGVKFGRNAGGESAAVAVQLGVAGAGAGAIVSDRDGQAAQGIGGALAATGGAQGSLSVTSNEDNGSATSRAKGVMNGNSFASIDIDANRGDDNSDDLGDNMGPYVSVTQRSGTTLRAGGEAETTTSGGGDAYGAGGGAALGLAGTAALTRTGAGHLGVPYNILDTLGDGTVDVELLVAD